MRNPKHPNDRTVSPDFEKIFRCIDSCLHSEQMTVCNRMIDQFAERHPNDGAIAVMLKGIWFAHMRHLMDQAQVYQPLVKPFVTRKVKYLLQPLNWN